MIETREYVDQQNRSPFGRWFDQLEPRAAAKVTVVVERLAEGNFSDVKPVGEGVSERRINYGPGYRIYFGQDGDQLIILLGGGTKQSQETDIARAKVYWRDYKKRKRRGE